ncbi:MAG TPA: ATP-dependent DNA helicase RecG [Alphaproteobacteria bacterium]|nr:ATP-dependent DNA helicase RecG [Alphaproteobacteria bacterium]
MRPNILNYFFLNLSAIKGVGEKSGELLIRLLEANNRQPVIKDVLFHLPHTILKYQKEPDLQKITDGELIITTVQVIRTEVKTLGPRKKYYKVITTGNNSVLNLVFFNASEKYINDVLSDGSIKIIVGKAERFKGELQITHPAYILPAGSSDKVREYEPVYPLTEGLNNKFLARIISEALQKIPELPEWQDGAYLKKNNWQGFKNSLHNIHNPTSTIAHLKFSPDRQRLAYDELLASQLALGLSRKMIAKQKGKTILSSQKFEERFLNKVGFKLTNSQNNVLAEIFTDMKSENRMFRLLQGDVGSGKTIVAVIAMLNALEAGFQTTFMAPTEILAKQQFEFFKSIIKQDEVLNENIKPVLLTGSLKPSEKSAIQNGIAEGEYNIIFGTHSLFQEKVIFKNLAFAVIDEQHRFGVKQRMELGRKGGEVDILLMTATPIPRTLAMTLYGDMEISILDEKPAGRKPIDTRIMSVDKSDELIEAIKRKLKEGSRVYWVCPLIEEGTQDEILEGKKLAEGSAEKRYEMLKKIFGEKVVLVHGKLKPELKNHNMEKFKTGEATIMVSTTVIEVGVNVPEANIMIIEEANKFGLSQLHQLRGRVGRGAEQSTCILLYGKGLSENGVSRLKILRETEDGFRISEEDMALRGSGDLLGTKQSGMPDFKIAQLPEDKEFLFAARDDVKIIINKDPELKTERGLNLRNLLYLFEYDNQIANLSA